MFGDMGSMIHVSLRFDDEPGSWKIIEEESSDRE